MSLIAVAYPKLASKDYDRIQSVRTDYDKPNINIIAPHFTFIFPVENIRQAEFIDHVSPIIRGFPQIEFELKYFELSRKVFEGRWYLFLVPDKGRNEITRLHDLLYTGLLARELNPEYSYTPHITVGCLEDKIQCQKIVKKLNNDDFCITGRINSIDVAIYMNNTVESIANFKLK